MPPDIEDRKIGGDHPRLRDPVSSPPPLDPRGGRGLLHLRGHGADRDRKEGKNRREHRKACSRQDGRDAPSPPDGGSTAQTFGRTASFTVIFAFFRNSTMYASIAFSLFSFHNAARICSLTIARGIFFPSRTIDAECSA